MEYLVGISYIVILAIFVLFIYSTNKISRDLRSANSDLLNRLMAKDYKEYAVFEHNKEVLKVEKQETLAQKLMTPDLDVYRVD